MFIVSSIAISYISNIPITLWEVFSFISIATISLCGTTTIIMSSLFFKKGSAFGALVCLYLIIKILLYYYFYFIFTYFL
jgi:hypothetical protein